MWQEMTIWLIGIVVLFYIGKKYYNIFFQYKKGKDCGCSCKGCSLKSKKTHQAKYNKSSLYH
ncbi:FeoB-associated Cys-rich membrane protein [Parabacteroides faecis]|uniref:FeoB-associated Cys-rich membrane protein n=2 Tax=Parabacteroides faecis TaxID=1217282 RepID=A0ABR6KRE7_9BACT|nr:FeoB-associated Cys-rich membrane protein [Parabacteroides faecis]MBB4624082.1 hypothetical protein [Parabacteroides faecis]